MAAEWIPVLSTTISRIRWDKANQILEIEFQNGRAYQYFDVPEHVFLGLRDAHDSHGRFFNDNIKGVYRYVRV